MAKRSHRLTSVIGNATVRPSGGDQLPLAGLISTTLLMERPYITFGNDQIDHYARMVENQINVAVGSITANMWSVQSVTPELEITDQRLADRCLPLLRQSTPADTIIRDATVILEERIREKLGHVQLSEIMPQSSNQTGERMVSTLFKAATPVISVSADQFTSKYHFAQSHRQTCRTSCAGSANPRWRSGGATTTKRTTS
jgi:hypothetical protein